MHLLDPAVEKSTTHFPMQAMMSLSRTLSHAVTTDTLIYMTLLALFCCIFKPIKICRSGFTLGKQAKHHACEPAYHLG